MKQQLLIASLLLATLSALPSATAETTYQCHGPLDGQQSCEVQQGTCHAGESYDTGDVQAFAECRPGDGKSLCGVYASNPPLVVTYDCRGNQGQIWPPKDIVSTSSAESPAECHGPLDGFQYCTVDAGDCQAGEVYERGTVHVYAACQPTDGKSVCGVDAYSSQFFDLAAGYHCLGREGQILPLGIQAAAAQPCTLDHDVAPGYVNIDLDCGRLVNCHINNIEDSTRTCSSETAGCTAEALGVGLDTQYTECHGAVTTASSGTSCEQYPGYEQCDYPVGPCTVTTTHYYHDARYTVEVCGLVFIDPTGATSSTSTTTDSGSGCQQHPGYERCDYSVGPCTVTTYYFYHDAFYMVEGPTCEKPGVATASADGRECQTYPGYTDCVYTVGPCSVTTRWYHHDAFYVVYGPDCEKPSVATAASSPLWCGGTDGRLECEAVAGPCHAGFYYQNPELEDVHAQCF